MKALASSKFDSDDFRLRLQHELLQRCQRNRSYSIRAFARSLAMDHSTLSKILSGKRKLSAKAIRSIGTRIPLSSREIETFISAQKALRSNVFEDRNRDRLVKYDLILHDTFIAISDWCHDAILEVTHLAGFVGEPRWIAKTLGISVTEVKIAVERLVRLGMLQISDRGKWIDVSRSNTNIIDHDFTSAAMRTYQKKVLEMSTLALEETPRALRDHTSMMVAIDVADIPAFKEAIKKFRYDFADFAERAGARPTAVYQLGVSFFPVSKVSERGDP